MISPLHSTTNRRCILFVTLFSSLLVGIITHYPTFGWEQLIFQFLSFGVIAWLTDLLMYGFSVIRVKSVLLICMTLWFLTSILWIDPGFEPLTVLIVPIMLSILQLLFSNYHRPNVKERSFWVTFLWLIMSWISPALIWLLPFLWFGYYMMRAPFLPLFLSSLISFLFVSSWILGYLYLSDHLPLLQTFIDTALPSVTNILHFSDAQLLWVVYMGLLTLLFQTSFMMRLYSDKMRTRTFLEYIMLLHIGCWILLFIFGFGHILEYLIAIFTALFTAHHLTLVDNKMSLSLFTLILLIPMIIAICLAYNF